MNIWMTLAKALDLYPEKIGVIDGGQSYTYRQVGERVAGLAVSANRSITVDYDVDALVGNDAINTLIDYLPWIFITCSIGFPIAGLAIIIMGVRDRFRA